MVYLAQLLCVNRHAILGLALEADAGLDLDSAHLGLSVLLDDAFDRGCKDGILKRSCGICQSTAFHVETGLTKYATMAEAAPELRRQEAAQQASRRYLKATSN